MNHQAWHSLDTKDVLAALGSSPDGLTSAEAERRLQTHGPNVIAAARGVSRLAILVAQLKNPLVAVLVVAAAISLIAGKEIDAIVIGVVIAFNTVIGFLQEYRAEAALEALRSRAAPEADVIRRATEAGEAIEMQIPAIEVVPGDVLMLNAGDKIPADARIFQAYNLEIDESMLTGESLAVAKVTEPLPAELQAADWTNVAFAGTIVTQGRGSAVVYATGQQTEIGKIATLIEETDKVESPLQKQTLDLGKKSGLPGPGRCLPDAHPGAAEGPPLPGSLPLRSGLGCLVHPGGPASGDDHHPGGRGEPYGEAQRHHPSPASGGYPGGGDGDLHRQDRHPDQK